MQGKSNVIKLSAHQYPTIDRLALRVGLLGFHGDDCRLIDEYSQLSSHWSVFRGAKILVHSHLTSMTLLLLDALLNMGAQIYFAVSPPLVVHDHAMGDYDALSPLKRSGIPHHIGDLEHLPWTSVKWDLMLDCGGMLYQHTQSGLLMLPKKGIVELSNTLYPASLNTSVMHLDRCEAKRLEVAEAGEGFVRAMAHTWVKEVLALGDGHHSHVTDDHVRELHFGDVFQGRFVVFGFGRLGKSVAYGLLRAGLQPHKLLIVDKHRGVIRQARQLLPLSESVVLRSPEEAQDVLSGRLSDVFCAIACTGVKGALASLPLSLFESVTHFSNMGTHNEWHESIPNSRFLSGVRHPLNFILATPTSPAVSALLMYTVIRSAEYALNRQHGLPAGMLPLPPFLEQEIADSWIMHRKRYGMPRQSHYLDQMDQAVNQLIRLLTQPGSQEVSKKPFSQAALLRHFGFGLHS